MNEPAKQFIIGRVVADYVRLREKGIAPKIGDYASFWSESPSTLLRPLMLEN